MNYSHSYPKTTPSLPIFLPLSAVLLLIGCARQGSSGEVIAAVPLSKELSETAVPDTMNNTSQHGVSFQYDPVLATSVRVEVEPDAELQDTEPTRPVGEADPLPVIIPPVGLVYRATDGLWVIGADGRPQQLLEVPDYMNPLPAPDLAHVAYADDDRRLWLVDLAEGSERQLAEGVAVAWPKNDRGTSLIRPGRQMVRSWPGYGARPKAPPGWWSST